MEGSVRVRRLSCFSTVFFYLRLQDGFGVGQKLERRRGLGNLQLFLVHVRGDGLVQGRGHVSLGGVGKHGEDHRALGRLLRHLKRARHGGAAGDTGEDTLHARELLRRLDRLGAGDGHELVVQVHGLRVLQHLGDEVGGPALDGVRGERGVRPRGRARGLALGGHARRDEPRGFGFEEHDLGVRARRLERAADTLERSAGAVAGDEVVQLLTREILQDLGPGGGRVERGVGVVLKLRAEEPAVLRAELLRLGHHAGALARLGRHDHLRAQHAHDLAALHGEGLGHADHAVVPALRANHRDGDAGVPGGGLHHGVALLQHAAALGVGDHGESQTACTCVRRRAICVFSQQRG